jgi:hypothetical protein
MTSTQEPAYSRGRTPPGGPHPDVERWDGIARHLTAAHGTNPRAIESYAPTLGQLEAEHWTAHLADDATGLIFQHSRRPHSHPGPLPEGERYRMPGSYAPFPPAPAWQAADPWALPGPDTAQHQADGREVPGGPEAGQ